MAGGYTLIYISDKSNLYFTIDYMFYFVYFLFCLGSSAKLYMPITNGCILCILSLSNILRISGILFCQLLLASTLTGIIFYSNYLIRNNYVIYVTYPWCVLRWI